MNQKELSKILGISESMVSKLVKKGMPKDTSERAIRWRKRHLEQSRLKGIRNDAFKLPKISKPKQNNKQKDNIVSVIDIEKKGRLVYDSIAKNNMYAANVQTHNLRLMLRKMPIDFRPKLNIIVWFSLIEYMVSVNDFQINDLDLSSSDIEFYDFVKIQVDYNESQSSDECEFLMNVILDVRNNALHGFDVIYEGKEGEPVPGLLTARS